MKFSNAILLATIAACAGSSLADNNKQRRRVQVASPTATSKLLEPASALRRRQLRKLQDEEEEEMDMEMEMEEPETEEEEEPEMEMEEPETEEEEPEAEEEEEPETEEEEPEEEEEEEEEEEDEEEDEEEEEDDEEEEAALPTEMRECQTFEDRINQFQFECNALETEGQKVIEDQLKFRVTTANNGLVIKVEYEKETETDTTETETEMGFDVRFDKLIEYRKGSFIEADEDDEDEQAEIEVADGEEENETEEEEPETETETEEEETPETETEEAEEPEEPETETEEEPEMEAEEPETEVEEEEPETETEEEDEEEDTPVAEARQAGGASVPADNAFQFEGDTVIQEWDLSDWADLSNVTQSANGNLLTFSATALGGIAEFTFTIAQAPEGAISANSMKIDVTIDGFPWSEPGTYLALLSHVDTENDVTVKEDEEDTEDGDTEEASMSGPTETNIGFSQISDLLGYEAFGRYSWAPTAEATTNSTDGRALQMTNNIQVVATVKEGDEGMTKQDIAFSFVGEGASGASRIYWDPEAGVGYSTDISASTVNANGESSASSFKFGALALAAIAAPALLF